MLEGVAFGLRDSFELMKAAGLANIDQVRISGGGAQSPLWRQILADVFDTELVTVNTTEGAAYGAALLAGVGCGIYSDIDTASAQAVQITGSTAPHSADVEKYDRLYTIYAIYNLSLKEDFAPAWRSVRANSNSTGLFIISCLKTGTLQPSFWRQYDKYNTPERSSGAAVSTKYQSERCKKCLTSKKSPSS